MTAPSLSTLTDRCEFAAAYWGNVVSGITAVTYREHGEQALHTLSFRIISGHQRIHYLEGLKKLGIEGLPPAIAAARYHYFSNTLGGLKLQYIEESPRKVWLRYLGPNGTFPGLAMLAVPAAVRRTLFSGWHPRNGRLMGCPCLGWVLTKTTMEGNPYDEGYFQEYDYELDADQTLRFEAVSKTPEFDPTKAPRLDEQAWPPERRVKARLRYAEAYLRSTVGALESMFGETATHFLVQQAMRGFAVQFSPALRAQLGVAGTDVDSVVAFFRGILEACGEDFEVVVVSPRHARIVRRSFKPFDGPVSEGLRSAFFGFQEVATWILNGHVRISRRFECGVDIWDVEDMGRWLW